MVPGIPRIPVDLFNTTCSVKRATVQRNQLGEAVRTYTTLGPYPARLDRFRYSGSTATWAEQGVVDIPSHKLFCPTTVEMAPGDRVSVGGIEYEVLEVFEPGGFSHHKEVWLKRGV
jgi:hypothetical protein